MLGCGAWLQAKNLDYFGMGFGDEEMRVLCKWFWRCQEAEELYLMHNAFTETGWAMLAEMAHSDLDMCILDAVSLFQHAAGHEAIHRAAGPVPLTADGALPGVA